MAPLQDPKCCRPVGKLRRNGRKPVVLRCRGKVKPRLTCGTRRAAQALLLGTARAPSLTGCASAAPLESKLYPAAVLLCYSCWLLDFIRRRARRCRRKAVRQRLACPLKPAAEAVPRSRRRGSRQRGWVAWSRWCVLPGRRASQGEGWCFCDFWDRKRDEVGKGRPLRRGRCAAVSSGRGSETSPFWPG